MLINQCEYTGCDRFADVFFSKNSQMLKNFLLIFLLNKQIKIFVDYKNSVIGKCLREEIQISKGNFNNK